MAKYILQRFDKALDTTLLPSVLLLEMNQVDSDAGFYRSIKIEELFYVLQKLCEGGDMSILVHTIELDCIVYRLNRALCPEREAAATARRKIQAELRSKNIEIQRAATKKLTTLEI